jgi:hypothetical protein
MDAETTFALLWIGKAVNKQSRDVDVYILSYPSHIHLPPRPHNGLRL